MAQTVSAQIGRIAQVEAVGLKVRYGDVDVLTDINFVVHKGEFVSIVGKSGEGKSTLLHALAGFSQRVGHVRIPKHLGMVFQNYAAFPWLTVRNNIGFGLHGLKRSERDRVISEYLELMELADHANKYPTQLSGGQTQRVALARALAPRPEVVLMDEPFGALDMITRDRMHSWLLDIWEKEQKTVLFVTHNIEEAVFLSDRVMVLSGGKIVNEFAVPFQRPRSDDLKFAEEFVRLRREIFDQME